jgi:hypothetical protein
MRQNNADNRDEETLVIRKCEVCKGEAINGFLCAECRARFYEGLAALIDKAYNPKEPQTWERCAAVIAKMYGTNWENEINYLDGCRKYSGLRIGFKSGL